MLKITALKGDITEQRVDAVVNAANTAMRGGGGVDGAIHRAGGPAILRDCIERFPHGLATGDAGWTTAGDLPARWVIHAVGPNYRAGETDRFLLESCYQRALEAADEIGARTVAFPLISAGIYGWPQDDAIAVAIETIATADTRVEEVRIVAFDDAMEHQVWAQMLFWTGLRIMQGVQLLHRRGYQRLRILPGLSASGMYWRIAITDAANLARDADLEDWDAALKYTTGNLTEFAGGEVTAGSTPDAVADLILDALPTPPVREDDPGYAVWFTDLVSLVARQKALPIAYAEYFDTSKGWEIGTVRFPLPPKPPRGS